MTVGTCVALCIIGALALPSVWRGAKRFLGLKERMFMRCRMGDHVWRIAYGDERTHHGKWHCEKCPANDRYLQRRGLPL